MLTIYRDRFSLVPWMSVNANGFYCTQQSTVWTNGPTHARLLFLFCYFLFCSSSKWPKAISINKVSAKNAITTRTFRRKRGRSNSNVRDRRVVNHTWPISYRGTFSVNRSRSRQTTGLRRRGCPGWLRSFVWGTISDIRRVHPAETNRWDPTVVLLEIRVYKNKIKKKMALLFKNNFTL